MADLAEVIERLQAAQARLDDAAGSLVTAHERTDRARGLVTEAVGGSTRIVGFLAAISDGIGQVGSAMAAARGKLEQTIAKVRDLDRRGGSGSSPGPARTVRRVTSPGQDASEPVRDRRDVLRRVSVEKADSIGSRVGKFSTFHQQLAKPRPTGAHTGAPTAPSATPAPQGFPVEGILSAAVTVGIVVPQAIAWVARKLRRRSVRKDQT